MEESKNIKKFEENHLIEEFKTAWTHLGLLDSRRYHIFQYYSAFIGVSVGATVASFKFLSGSPVLQNLFPSAIFALVFVISLTSVQILRSERKATERYRDKINLIRKVFLGTCNNNDIAVALKNKGVGSSFEIVPCIKNDLSLNNFLAKEMRCTALYIKALIQIIGFIAIVLSFLFIILTVKNLFP